MAYELYYWPGIPGRGEFVRLALEDAGAPYRDVAREDGVKAILSFSKKADTPSFAPPYLRDGDLVIGQTAAILLYLGPRLGLVAEDEKLRLWTHQIQLTIADAVVGAHDSHHPLGSNFYYEDQKPELQRRAADFRATRLPKFLGWFETVLQRNAAGSEHLVGAGCSYADLSLFHLIEGLTYAFPQRMAALAKDYPLTMALRDRVRTRSRLAAYLASPRRLPFNENGIFRHYPELDGEE